MIKILTATLFFILAVFSPPATAQQTDSTLDLGLEFSRIVYKEPSLIKETGMMLGIHGVYSFYGLEHGPAGLRLDGRLSTGTVTYEGQYANGTPVQVSGIRDYMFEARGMFGIYNLGEPGTVVMPWIGVGYRYLYDGMDKVAGGYQRQSNYYYIPVLLERIPAQKPGWSLGWSAEYDYFLAGSQSSYLSDINSSVSDLKNRQTDGFGYRGSVRFLWREQARTVTIEPFIRYWRIAQSKTATVYHNGAPIGVGWEPQNNSTEIGLQAAITF